MRACMETKIHLRRKPGMQSSKTARIHHRPSAEVTSGQPEGAEAGQLKSCNPGRTGKRLLSTTEGPKDQGELERGQSEEPETKEESG